MAPFPNRSYLFGILITTAAFNKLTLQQKTDLDPWDNLTNCNCSTTERISVYNSLSSKNESDSNSNYLLKDDIEPKEVEEEKEKETNISHYKTFPEPTDWDGERPVLNFPKATQDDRYKMANLHLDKGIFIFDFLRKVLVIVQPYDAPIDLITHAIEDKIDARNLIYKLLRLEAPFMVVIAVCGILMFVVPATELYLACRPLRYNYKSTRRPGLLSFFLILFVLIIGTSMVTMMICNEEIGSGIDKFPTVMEAALQDLGDYHAGTSIKLRKSLTRSLDVASDAILADLDNVEDLLGKPVQSELAAETGLDVALDALVDVGNISQELSYKVDMLMKSTQRARDQGSNLGQDAENLRRELETAMKSCSFEDRSLCATLNPSGLHVALRLDRIIRDDRLSQLRQASKENLTEASRQARGEYLYVPHHISRKTLDARNLMRREINVMRSRIFEETRDAETMSNELSKQLDSARRIINDVVPYLNIFEYFRWFVGLGTILCLFFIWLLMSGALCCRCGSSDDQVRPTLLWMVFFSCFISMALWLVFLSTLALSAHADMLFCRPLHDPEYRTIESVIETRAFLGRRMSVSLKDLLEKCQQNEAAYPSVQLDKASKLEQLTAYWTWTGVSRALTNLKVDLTGLKILSPVLQLRLQNLLYASGTNLSEHRIMIQGPILEQDINTLSDQIENVARQMHDRRSARIFQSIASSMRDLLSRQVKPLMKVQDELIYQLAMLEVQLQPLQRQVNQSLSHLKTIQYYIDNQGDKIAQIKTKVYRERLTSYLDQWRKFVLTEMGTDVSKCRPLWEVVHGVRLLLCQHILGPLNGFWFCTLLCAVIMILSTPMAHSLASVYRKHNYRKDKSFKDLRLLHTRTSSIGSPETISVDPWTIPEPPPLRDNW